MNAKRRNRGMSWRRPIAATRVVRSCVDARNCSSGVAMVARLGCGYLRLDVSGSKPRTQVFWVQPYVF